MKTIDLLIDFLLVVVGGLAGGFVLALYLDTTTNPKEMKTLIFLIGLSALFGLYWLLYKLKERRK